MLKKFLIIFICILTLCGCGNKEVTNRKLNGELSAKQLAKACEPYIDEVLNNHKYHIGQINMVLDKSLKGNITITYAEEVSRGEPYVWKAVIDTKDGQIQHIKKMGRDSKLNPGKIDFYQWKIDSTDAVKITEDLFKADKDFQYDEVIITSDNMYKENQEIWQVELYNSSTKKGYCSDIDPITGKVYDSGINQH